MSRHTFVLGFISLIFLVSCQSNPDVPTVINSSVTAIDTIFPGSYFPAYPGSEWVYLNEKGELSRAYTLSQYRLDSIRNDVVGMDYGPVCYVPIHVGAPFSNQETPIWEYSYNSTVQLSNGGSTHRIGLLEWPSQVGDGWPVRSWQANSLDRKITAVNQSLTIDSTTYYPTLVVEEFFGQGPPNYIWKHRYYFTENIGLVKIEWPDSTYLELNSYFINQ